MADVVGRVLGAMDGHTARIGSRPQWSQGERDNVLFGETRDAQPRPRLGHRQNKESLHHALQMPEHDTCIDAAAYVRRLCLSISRSKLDHMQIDLVLAACHLPLQSDRRWRLGMIVYELITMRRGTHLPVGKGGFESIYCAGAFVECRVLDNGSAPVNVQPGRGLKIVLGGRFRLNFGTAGSTSILVFPRDGGIGSRRKALRDDVPATP